MKIRLPMMGFVALVCTIGASAGAPAAPDPIPSPVAPSPIATAAPSPAPSVSASPAPGSSLSPAPGPQSSPSASPSASPSPNPTTPPPSIPPPPVPPRDARGISVTTPPIAPQSPVPTPTVPDALWFAQSDSSTIQIEVHDGVVFLPVVADGRRRTFVLDTRVHTAVDDSMTSVPQAPAWVLGTLQIGDVRLTNLLVTPQRILPFSQTYLGAPADGAIGMDLLSKFPVTIDYANRRLTLYQTTAEAVSARQANAVVLPLSTADGVPIATARVEGKYQATVAIDPLATTEAVISDGFARAHSLAREDRWIDTAWLARPSGEIAGRMGRVSTLTLGSLDIPRPITIAASATDPNALPHGADGALGAWLLQRFVVTIDVPGSALVLAPTSDASMAAEPFDRSGAWLVQRGGGVEVRSVLAGSPAASAGLRSGDLLLDINNRPLTGLEDARTVFSGALGTSISVRFHRIWTRTTTLTLHTVM